MSLRNFKPLIKHELDILKNKTLVQNTIAISANNCGVLTLLSDAVVIGGGAYGTVVMVKNASNEKYVLKLTDLNTRLPVGGISTTPVNCNDYNGYYSCNGDVYVEGIVSSILHTAQKGRFMYNFPSFRYLLRCPELGYNNKNRPQTAEVEKGDLLEFYDSRSQIPRFPNIPQIPQNKMFTAMELLDGDFYSTLVKNNTNWPVIEDDLFMELYIQCMCAAHFMDLIGIRHNDLHMGNIFLQNKVNNPTLESFTEFYYDLGASNARGGRRYLKFPINDYFVKLSDFGMAIVYDKSNSDRPLVFDRHNIDTPPLDNNSLYKADYTKNFDISSLAKTFFTNPVNDQNVITAILTNYTLKSGTNTPEHNSFLDRIHNLKPTVRGTVTYNQIILKDEDAPKFVTFKEVLSIVPDRYFVDKTDLQGACRLGTVATDIERGLNPVVGRINSKQILLSDTLNREYIHDIKTIDQIVDERIDPMDTS